jgi:NDP-sugar pyrophosphorylase family protein
MKRQRVTVTLKEDIVNQVDQLIDGLQIRSRSQAVEYLLSKTLSEFSIRNVLILAGGYGKRMGNLVKDTPRSLLLVKGKPILQHIIERLQSFNINHFLIYVDHLGDQIMNYFGDGSSFGVSIEYLVGNKPQGTIYPLNMARSKINDTFLVVYGDTISSLDINDFLEFHRKNQNLATVALTTVSNPRDYGVINLKGNKITMFKEKPKTTTDSYLVSGGMFIFEPRIFNYISTKMKSIEDDLFPGLVDKRIISGYPFQGLWLNINNPKDLKKARIIL